MNYEDLLLKLPYIQASSGHTLTIEERAALQNSLAILKNNTKLHHLQFWGKFYATQRDYLIVQGYSGKDLLGEKNLFCSYNGIDWVQLPTLSEETKEHCKKLSVLSRPKLVGDLAHEYIMEVLVPETNHGSTHLNKQPHHVDEEDEGEDDDIEDGHDEVGTGQKRGPVKSRIAVTEESWLVHLVNSIEFDTAIVPRGAVTLDATRHTVINNAFSGLTSTQANTKQFYVHTRHPITFSKKTLLQKEGLSKFLDFLDIIDEDCPKGSWSLQTSKSTPQVVIRNLLWPGFFFYHVPGTPNYGHCYFGFGDKNSGFNPVQQINFPGNIKLESVIC